MVLAVAPSFTRNPVLPPPATARQGCTLQREAMRAERRWFPDWRTPIQPLPPALSGVAQGRPPSVSTCSAPAARSNQANAPQARGQSSTSMAISSVPGSRVTASDKSQCRSSGLNQSI
jgi:hypothetical protein